MEQKEGWFDAEGWRIDDPSDQQTQNWWFPDPSVRPGEQPRPLNVVVGQRTRLVARGMGHGSRHVAQAPR